MKLVDLDKDPRTGDAPLTNVIRHLRACLASTAVTWNDDQRLAAEQACSEAENLLGSKLVVNAIQGTIVLKEEALAVVPSKWPPLLLV